MIEPIENDIAFMFYDGKLAVDDQPIDDENNMEEQPSFVDNIKVRGGLKDQGNDQTVEPGLLIPPQPHITINCVSRINQNELNGFLKLHLRNGFRNTCAVKYPKESCRWALYFKSCGMKPDHFQDLKTRLLNLIGGAEIIDSSLLATDNDGQIRMMIAIRNFNCNGHPLDFSVNYQWIRPSMRHKYDIIILNDGSNEDKILRIEKLKMILPKMLKWGFKLNPASNENGSCMADGKEFSCVVNSEDLTFDSETHTHNISKTNSSQCNTNSQISCCRNVENSASCLGIAHQESNNKSQTISPRSLQFCNVISPEIITNLRSAEVMNGASRENDVTQKIPSVDASDISSSNTNCNMEKVHDSIPEISYISYESENQMPDIMKLIQKDLSEPYSIYTYRYFIHNWPHLCFLAVSKGKSVGAIVCKLDLHRKIIKRGYIAMLAVDECFRKKGIGSNLVLKAIRVMATEGADEVVLETEITNQPALRLYENLGFVRDKRLFRYYLNGVDALRLKLWLR